MCRSAERSSAQVNRPFALRQRSMGLERLPSPRSRCMTSATAMAAATAEEATEQDFTWKGSDDFTHLEDRKDATPLPLPSLTESKRVVLVRHGQSTWNAEGRIQGSTDFAELTDKGRAQADTTRVTVSALYSTDCYLTAGPHKVALLCFKDFILVLHCTGLYATSKVSCRCILSNSTCVLGVTLLTVLATTMHLAHQLNAKLKAYISANF